MSIDDWEIRRTWRALHKQPIVPDKLSGYGDLIDTIGVDVLGSFYIGSYQGDQIYLVKEGPYYGYLVFGYGSCGGCDAYEASRDSVDQLTELRDSLENSIHWEPTLRDMRRWAEEHDWKGDYFGSDDDEVKHQFLDLVAKEERDAT